MAMLRSLRLLWLGTALLGTASAHQVPNMTIEADFAANGTYTLRINLDPRVFLSEQPTSLPPITADWYLNQSETEKQTTHEIARTYLQANLGLHFGGKPTPLPDCAFVALDGADNTPLRPDTAETHLLATAQGQWPTGADRFLLDFGPDARVSLILLNSLDGQAERRPQVLFPGESSRPFVLPVSAPAPAPPVKAAATTEVQKQQVLSRMGELVLLLIGSVLLLCLGPLIRALKRRFLD